MRCALLGVMWAGCTAKSTTTTSAPDSADTGGPDTVSDTPWPADSGGSGLVYTDNACPPDVAPIAILACAESTQADPPQETFTLSGTALVTEVGSALDPIPGSLPLIGFNACDGSYLHQVRLVDDYGDIWTLGWDIEGDIDDDSTKMLLPGAELAFYVTWIDWTFAFGSGVLLADEVGPLFLFEQHLVLEEAARAVTLEVDWDSGCYVTKPNGNKDMHHTVTFSWYDGEVLLRSGQTAIVPLPGRELEVVVGHAYHMLGYQDGSPGIRWAGWAEEP